MISGNAIYNMTETEFLELYNGKWDDTPIEKPRKCKICGVALEKWGKHYSYGGGIYYIGWANINSRLSPNCFLCVDCYEKEQRKLRNKKLI